MNETIKMNNTTMRTAMGNPTASTVDTNNDKDWTLDVPTFMKKERKPLEKLGKISIYDKNGNEIDRINRQDFSSLPLKTRIAIELNEMIPLFIHGLKLGVRAICVCTLLFVWGQMEQPTTPVGTRLLTCLIQGLPAYFFCRYVKLHWSKIKSDILDVFKF